MKTEDKENASADKTETDGGETSKSKEVITAAQPEPQPSTSTSTAAFPNLESDESSNSLEAKDALFEVSCTTLKSFKNHQFISF